MCWECIRKVKLKRGKQDLRGFIRGDRWRRKIQNNLRINLEILEI